MARLPAFLSSMMPGDAGGGTHDRIEVAGFGLNRQRHTNWCWVAVTQAVERTMSGVTPSQGDIASFHIANGPGGSCGNFDPSDTAAVRCDSGACQSPCNAPHSLTRILKERGRFARPHQPPFDYSAVKAELAGGRPVPCRVAWNDGGGGAHFVCIGACADDGGQEQFVTVWDPSNPDIGTGPADNAEMRWEELRDDYRLGARTGQLTHVYGVQ